jgi:hypothetical protein
MDTTLTEAKIQRVLNKFMASPKYKVDGLFVFRWESDKLLWTKAGYIYEFEIKISRADYQNDFKHKADKHLLLSSKMPKESGPVQEDLFDHLLKHEQKRYPGITKEQLHTYPENTKLPNFFYYAVPEGMLDPDEVPPYAGLIYITTSKGPKYHCDDPDKWHHDIKIVRKAPQLHKTKYTDAELNLGEKFYYNMQTWKHNYREQVNYSLMYRQRLQDELQRKGIDKSYLEMADALKEAERRAEFAEHNVAHYKQMNYNLEDDANYNRIERHMFMDMVKELKPDFDYKEFTKKSR